MGASQVLNGSSLAGWLSPSQVRPADVHDFTMQLVAASEHGRTKVCRMPLNAKHDGFRLLSRRADRRTPPYHRVNGVLQPGGRVL